MALKLMDTFTGTYEVDDSTDVYLLATLDQLLKETPRRRIKIDYGDIHTGKSWNETYGVTGYIGRSTGPLIRLFILLPNKSSSGGGAILTGNILSIRHANKKNGGVIYQRGPHSYATHESQLPQTREFREFYEQGIQT